MRVLVQRCDKALVRVNDNVVGSINKGLMILVGFTEGDNFDTIKYMADKVVNLRVFDDGNGVMNKSLLVTSLVFYLLVNLLCMVMLVKGEGLVMLMH